MAGNRDSRHPDDGTAASRSGLILFWIYVAL